MPRCGRSHEAYSSRGEHIIPQILPIILSGISQNFHPLFSYILPKILAIILEKIAVFDHSAITMMIVHMTDVHC